MYAYVLMHLSRFGERYKSLLEPSALNGLSVTSTIISIYFYPLVIYLLFLHGSNLILNHKTKESGGTKV